MVMKRSIKRVMIHLSWDKYFEELKIKATLKAVQNSKKKTLTKRQSLIMSNKDLTQVALVGNKSVLSMRQLIMIN